MTTYGINPNPSRFTSSLVSKVHMLLIDLAPSEDAKRFARESLTFIASDGRRSVYAGFCGRHHVEYGGYGARAAIMLFYAIGCVMDVWSEPLANGNPDVRALQEITTGFGDKFDEFRTMGREHAERHGWGVTFIENV